MLDQYDSNSEENGTMHDEPCELTYTDGSKLRTANDIRKAFQARYPDVDDYEETIEHSGYAHENPVTAIGVVLVCALKLGTTDVDHLAEFTGYDKRFIRAIAANMDNSHLWKDGKYCQAAWSSSSLLPSNEKEDQEFGDHIDIAMGMSWAIDAKSHLSEEADTIFWTEMRKRRTPTVP